MDEPSNPQTLQPGEIRFVDNYIPLLEADSYTIQVEQNLVGAGAHPVNAVFSEKQEFLVSGPRFRLDPADIQQKYPPPNSRGEFQYDLPHIVLTKRTLPWERCIFDPPYGDMERAVPWMALILLDPKEILPPTVGTNKDSQTVDPTGLTTIPVNTLQTHEEDLDPQETCQVFDIKWETFEAVVPKPEDLKFLAHCREVPMESKVIPGMGQHGVLPSAGIGTAWYSIVVGGRFPIPPPDGAGTGVLNVVHLVSLEGLAGYIDGTETFPNDTRIRLVSLASWVFTCLPERDESFSELMVGLVRDGQESINFRLPVQPVGSDEAAKYAAGMLSAGYVPRSYQTRQGEKTFAWYRGPFTPQRLPPLPSERHPFTSSAQAIIYDPEHGLFDLSYAGAWEIGRLMALADQRFGIHLLKQRRNAHRRTDLLQARMGFENLQTSLPQARGGNPYDGLLEDNLVSASFMRHLVSDFAREVEPAIFTLNDQQPSQAGSQEKPTSNAFSVLAGYQQQDSVQQFIQESGAEDLEPVCDWLAQLYLLYGVPFYHLVADERLLPPESIRFFYLDPNWLEVLLDGALSIGMHSSRDTVYQTQVQDKTIAQVLKRVQTMRARLLGKQTEADESPSSDPMAGLLLRSAAVMGWPGMEVRAYSCPSSSQPSEEIGLLRMDRLSEDVLFCLFPKVPKRIEFNEPKEGLHFGLQMINDTGEITLRFVSGPETTGKPNPQAGKLVVRWDDHRRLDIENLVKEMKNRLGLGEDDAFGPAAFALQMVKEPQQMVFETPGKA
jgi:hypothetical protein